MSKAENIIKLVNDSAGLQSVYTHLHSALEVLRELRQHYEVDVNLYESEVESLVARMESDLSERGQQMVDLIFELSEANKDNPE